MAPVYDDAKNCSTPMAGAEIEYAGFKVNVYPNMLFQVGKSTFAVEICEDLWTPIPPSSHHALAGADIIVNLSASNEILMKHQYRKSIISQLTSRTIPHTFTAHAVMENPHRIWSMQAPH